MNENLTYDTNMLDSETIDTNGYSILEDAIGIQTQDPSHNGWVP